MVPGRNKEKVQALPTYLSVCPSISLSLSLHREGSNHRHHSQIASDGEERKKDIRESTGGAPISKLASVPTARRILRTGHRNSFSFNSVSQSFFSDR